VVVVLGRAVVGVDVVADDVVDERDDTTERAW
jgi:hypothetical protein